MDQIKIGRFIAACRKRANLTQLQLADKLGITDKAVFTTDFCLQIDKITFCNFFTYLEKIGSN